MKLKDLLNRGLVDMVTVMGVNPGASGQTINSALSKAYYLELFNLSKKDKRLKKVQQIG